MLFFFMLGIGTYILRFDLQNNRIIGNIYEKVLILGRWGHIDEIKNIKLNI